MTIRILLIDDHNLFRSGLRLLLQKQVHHEVVGEAADGGEGLKLTRKLKPDIVLLDLNMPGLSGLDTLRLLVNEFPDVKVVILTVSEESDELAQALRDGARGYLLKNIESSDLAAAIEQVFSGQSVVSPAMTAKLVDCVREGSSRQAPLPPDYEKLTVREREIVRYLVQGKSNKEIAQCLNLADSTVKIHVQNVLKKLGLNSRVQVAVYAVERGLAE
ncbi:response regulator [Crenobacter intestini]|uniref:Response regulator transcription factor n=1 Tax=Crenobacter intestini TaxID=2563443 RepID=A0A4T0UK33_9NEIS|nr:response regulator transcription factor [Crenobacter intestini]TIC78756.1 response regulator transcription factor [Crenobacter intestini]